MGGDLGLLRGFTQDRQEVAGEAHGSRIASLPGPPTETGSAAKRQGLSKPSGRIFEPAAASRAGIHGAPQRREGKFHGLDVTNRARSDSVSDARSRREATRRHRPRSKSWEDKSREDKP